MDNKPIGKDADGKDILADAMKSLLNQYPGLHDGEKIKYEELGTDSGIAFYADAGALIYSEKEDVCGMMHQVCQYPFIVVYRTASDKERQKLSVQRFLDNLGKWICREPVTALRHVYLLSQDFPVDEQSNASQGIILTVHNHRKMVCRTGFCQSQ